MVKAQGAQAWIPVAGGRARRVIVFVEKDDAIAAAPPAIAKKPIFLWRATRNRVERVELRATKSNASRVFVPTQGGGFFLRHVTWLGRTEVEACRMRVRLCRELVKDSRAMLRNSERELKEAELALAAVKSRA